MKTILVLTGGSDSDRTVFDTAFAIAQPLGAHLDFLHIRVSSGQAALVTPHVAFTEGPALRDALAQLAAEAEMRSVAAARHCREFCERRSIPLVDAPAVSSSADDGLSASLCEESDDGVERIMRRARHRDLVVLGRRSRANGLTPHLIDLLLAGCGRPVLMAPPRSPRSLTGTILVCWNESAEAAHALAAAQPLLAKSRRVVIVAVGGSAERPLEDMRDVAEQLVWHGIAAEPRWMPLDGHAVAEQLEAAAADCDADLVVMGAYGHSRMRERIFGGCTQHFVDQAERPVLLMH